MAKRLSWVIMAAGLCVGAPALAWQGGDAGKSSSSDESAINVQGTNVPDDPGAVRKLQQALNDKGYDVGGVDGRWGPASDYALKNFQRDNGLQANGQLDNRTIAALGVSGSEFSAFERDDERGAAGKSDMGGSKSTNPEAAKPSDSGSSSGNKEETPGSM